MLLGLRISGATNPIGTYPTAASIRSSEGMLEVGAFGLGASSIFASTGLASGTGVAAGAGASGVEGAVFSCCASSIING